MDEIEEVVNQVINMAELLLTSERLLKAYAKFYRGIYMALIDVGFSAEEAFELISKLQIPASKSR